MHRVLSGGMACLGLALAVVGCGGSEDGGDTSSADSSNDTPGATTGDPGNSSGGNLHPQCAPGEVVAVSAGKGATPSIAWKSDRYAIAWQARESVPEEVRVALISPDGSKQSEHVLGTIGAAGPALPQVHATEGGFVVVWQDAGPAGTVIRAQTLGADGAPQGGPVEVGTSDIAEARPSSALVGSGVAIAWMDAQNTRFGILSGASMGATTTLGGARYPAVGSRSGTSEVALAWSTGSTLSFARAKNPGGAPQMMTNATVRTGAGEARLPRVAAGDGQWLVAWEDTRSSAERVYLARVDGSDEPLGEVRVAEGEESANWPDVAWTGSHAAVVYYQFLEGPPAVYLRLFGPDLSPASEPVKVSGKNARFPAVAVAGSDLGVTWSIKDGAVEFVHVTCD